MEIYPLWDGRGWVGGIHLGGVSAFTGDLAQRPTLGSDAEAKKIAIAEFPVSHRTTFRRELGEKASDMNAGFPDGRADGI
jgi:hypothetical protein